MSKRYIMRLNDDVREMAILLTRSGSEGYVAPTEAVLKIRTGIGVVSKTLTIDDEYENEDDEHETRWLYQWEADEIRAIGAGTYQCEVLATFNDERTVTFPTNGPLTLQILRVIE